MQIESFITRRNESIDSGSGSIGKERPLNTSTCVAECCRRVRTNETPNKLLQFHARQEHNISEGVKAITRKADDF